MLDRYGMDDQAPSPDFTFETTEDDGRESAMTKPYTPTTAQVARYWRYGVNAWADGVARQDDVQADGSSAHAEFHRWLVQHDREVAAKALREAANSMALRHTEWRDMRDDDGELIVRDDYSTSLDYAEALAKAWLRERAARADRIERGDDG